MEQLQQLLNFTNSEGEVIMVFGKYTLSQVVMFLLTLIVVVLAIKFIRGVVKLAIIVIMICVLLVHFNIASPTELIGVANHIKEVGVTTYEKFAEASDNIKIADGTIYVCIEDQWFDITEIKSMVSGEDGILTITAGDKTYVVYDKSVIDLLMEFK